MENISTSSSQRLKMDFGNMFDNMFTDMEKERRNRIKKLEKIRERRYLDCKSVRKIGAKGDFSYMDEYGRRLEEDMAVFKEITRQREEQENNWVERPLSPLPPLFDISPVHSPQLNYRLIGNEDYKASRLATMSEMGLNGATQELYGEESNPYCVPGPEGAAIAAERLNQINERIAKLKIRATEIQEGIQTHMSAQVSNEVNGTQSSESEQNDIAPAPEIKITHDGDENESKE